MNGADYESVMYFVEDKQESYSFPIYSDTPAVNGDPVLEDTSVTAGWTVALKMRSRPTSTSEVLYSSVGTVTDSVASISVDLPLGFPAYAWYDIVCLNSSGDQVLRLSSGSALTAAYVAAPSPVGLG